MMKLRKWSDLNKAEKLGRKNAFKSTLIITIPTYVIGGALLLFAITCFTPLSFVDAFGYFLVNTPSLLLLVFLLAFFLLPIVCYIYYRDRAINSAYDKLAKDYSKNLAEKMLVRGKPTKVKLLKTRDGHYEDFLLKDLPGRVDYYAVLEENHNIIVIYPKFSDENEKDFFNDISNERRNRFDFIEMEEFSSFCEIVDN